MLQIMKKIIAILGLVIIITVLILGLISFFVKADSKTKITYYGHGRPLSETPWLTRTILGENRHWVGGWGWLIGDATIFFGILGLGYSLSSLGFMKFINNMTVSPKPDSDSA